MNLANAGPAMPADVSTDAATASVAEREASGSFPVVGIGASAGGLNAFTLFLSHLPEKTGMAFVLIQHLDPVHESQLTDLLSKATRLPVTEVTNGMAVEPNHVYIIPPNVSMAIEKGVLRLTPRGEAQNPHLPVDFFFRSLAEDQQSRAIGVVLSGTGSDGSLGLAEIKAAGGITFAQDDDSAEYASMPQSAVAGGCVDFVLSPDKIARELAQIGQHPYLRPTPTSQDEPEAEGDFEKIVGRLRTATGVDFSEYRPMTIKRRIARRMALHKQDSLSDYMQFLQANPVEIQALYRDMLINVTSFFRDPDVFEALKTTVFPEIIKGKTSEDPVRIWVPGCATGQEAYSLAMALLEFLDQNATSPAIQIFGTDINDEAAVEKARPGVYPPSIEAEVSPGRLQRFFSKVEGGYRIGKAIRDLCVFARQDVTTDPPFSHLDLVSCRNVLIYLSPSLQQRIIPTFHYALNPGGFLLLGPSEAVGKFSDLFDKVDRKHNIYSRTAALSRPYPYLASGRYPPPTPARGAAPSERAPDLDMRRESDRIILSRFAPAAVLIDENLEILQFRGQTAPYLQSPSGQATHNILKMARVSLFLELRSVIDEARKNNATARRANVRVQDEGEARLVNLEVAPIRHAGSPGRYFLVLFMEAQTEATGAAIVAPAAGPSTSAAPADARDDSQLRRENAELRQEIAQLQQELASVKEYLQAIIEQQNAANEELQSANGEIRSANEELQTNNEEMQTAREELQSTNEELGTVNDELQARNQETTRLGDDLTNTLSSMKLPIVMLGSDLRIRRFTPAAATLLNLIATDVGRPFADIKSPFDIPDHGAMLLDVIATVAAKEQEVQDRTGNWYSMVMHPYRTDDNRIDGVVLVLRDITERKRTEESLRASEQDFRTLAETVPQIVWATRPDGWNIYFNQRWMDYTGMTLEESYGHGWNTPFHPEDKQRAWDAWQRAIQDHALYSLECRLRRSDGVYRWWLIRGAPIRSADGTIQKWFGTCTDIEDIKKTEAELLSAKVSAEQALATAENASFAKDHFLAVLSHELRTPLTPVLAAAAMLKADPRFDVDAREQLAVIHRNAEMEARLIDDLLDVTRIARGKVELDKRPVELSEVIRRAVEVCQPEIETRQLEFAVDTNGGPYIVHADAIRLQQVFWNLLRNAIKFTRLGGRVGIRCHRDGDGDGFVIAEVNDNGVGIRPEVIGSIFEAFEQGGVETTRQFGGLGLGLVISKGIVEMHGGTLEARSPGEGKGATFAVKLPLAVETAVAAAAPLRTSDHELRTAARPLRVLLVEDHGDTVRIMRRLLSADGHSVETAADVATALKLAGEQDFDVLVSDLGLPDGSGLDLMRVLRGRGSKLPGIALSGYGRKEDLQQSRQAGFEAHLVKPISPHRLAEAIAQVIGQKSTR